MLRDALFIAGKDLRYLIRERETIVWVFFLPIVFFYFIGTITAGFGSRESRETIAVSAPPDAGFLVEQLAHRLEERDYAVVRADPDSLGRYGRRLVIPGAATDSVLAGSPVTFRLELEEGGLGTQYDEIRVGRAVYSLLADFVVSGETGTAPSAEAFRRLNETPRSVTVQVTPAGSRRRVPSGFEQAIPGILVMFILLVMVTSGAVLIVIERRQGLLRRLAVTPITRAGVVAGKWGGKLGLGIVQIVFAMLAGTIFFGMDWGPDLPMIIVVLVVYAAMMAAVGLVLGSLARTEGQAIGIGVVSANVLAALGGCWWPIEITPAWMQALQLFLPTGWAMDALHRLISFGAGPASVLPHVVGMAVVTALLMGVGARVFRYE